MVSEPTPTTSVSFGLTPLGGSARAGPTAMAVADAATAPATISFLSVRMISAPPANEIGAPTTARTSPAGWPTAIALRPGPHCDKGTITGGYVIFWLTKSVTHMNQQVRVPLRECQIGSRPAQSSPGTSAGRPIRRQDLTGQTRDVHPGNETPGDRSPRSNHQ